MATKTYKTPTRTVLRINFPFDNIGMMQRIDETAKKTGLTRSSIVRRAIAHYFKDMDAGVIQL